MRKFMSAIFLCFCFSFASGSQKPTLAVLELEGNAFSTKDLQGLSNRLRSELFKTDAFTLLERAKMEEILKEQGFQQSGCVDTSCAVEIGQLIGVKKILLGRIDNVGNFCSIGLRLVDVATGKIEKDISRDIENCTVKKLMKTELYQSVRAVVGHFTQRARQKRPPQASTSILNLDSTTKWKHVKRVELSDVFGYTFATIMGSLVVAIFASSI